MSQNRVIKTNRIEAEKITGPLHEGLNVIKTVATSQYSTLKMELKYEVVVPYDQHNGDDYCLLSLSSINVSGRGGKTYGAEINKNLCNSFYEIEVKEDEILYNAELPERQILTGYHALKLEATYLTIRFIEFVKENEIDLTDDTFRKYVTSNETELNQLYCTHDVRGARVKNIQLFVMDNGFYYLQGCTSDCYELSSARYLSDVKHSDTSFIVDNKNRVWELQAVFTTVESVQSEQSNFVVSDGMLYQQIPLFGTKGKNDKYIALGNLMYSQLSKVKVHLLSEVPEPLFETNLSANTGYAGSGLYLAVMIKGTKMIIAPFINKYVSTDLERVEIVVVNNSIYAIVGRYDDVGFIREHYGFNDWIEIGNRPNEESKTFYESFSDIPLPYCDENQKRGQRKIIMTFYDKAFESRKPRYRIGDGVRVVKEMGIGTNVKGLEGVVIGLSENKAKVEVCFFGYFKAKFGLNQIERIREPEDIDLSEILQLMPDEIVEAILNERRITIVWDEGFDEFSPTSRVFKEFHGIEPVENYCLQAHIGARFEHTIFLTNGEFDVQLAKELILVGEFTCVFLDDRVDGSDANLQYVIYNAKAA